MNYRESPPRVQANGTNDSAKGLGKSVSRVLLSMFTHIFSYLVNLLLKSESYHSTTALQDSSHPILIKYMLSNLIKHFKLIMVRWYSNQLLAQLKKKHTKVCLQSGNLNLKRFTRDFAQTDCLRYPKPPKRWGSLELPHLLLQSQKPDLSCCGCR